LPIVQTHNKRKERKKAMETIKSRKENPLFTPALIPNGNNKLLDYDDENGNSFRYAQVNTRAVIDCPFATEGCKSVCYATKGNHQYSSVQESRENSRNETKRKDFSESILHTIATHKMTKRYKDSIMLIRIHESGDFYSMQYLRKWLAIWAGIEGDMNTRCVFYTKSFPFFLKLNNTEKSLINRMLESGQIAINLSVDDTTSPEQWKAYHAMRKAFPKVNTYYCTEHVDNVKHNNVCDCANCAKCGTCNKGTGEVTVVKIHSASKADMEVYRKNIVK